MSPCCDLGAIPLTRRQLSLFIVEEGGGLGISAGKLPTLTSRVSVYELGTGDARTGEGPLAEPGVSAGPCMPWDKGMVSRPPSRPRATSWPKPTLGPSSTSTAATTFPSRGPRGEARGGSGRLPGRRGRRRPRGAGGTRRRCGPEPPGPSRRAPSRAPAPAPAPDSAR